MQTVYLDESHRVPGIDHLDQYRDSCFYNLLQKSVKEKGNAFEDICAKILNAHGYDARVAPASYGHYDILVDGEKVELKSSRRASRYDTRGRSYQFPAILKDRDHDYMMLMIVQPDDIVKIYKTDFNRIEKDLKPSTGNSWNLSKHPDEIDADLILEVQMK